MTSEGPVSRLRYRRPHVCTCALSTWIILAGIIMRSSSTSSGHASTYHEPTLKGSDLVVHRLPLAIALIFGGIVCDPVWGRNTDRNMPGGYIAGAER